MVLSNLIRLVGPVWICERPAKNKIARCARLCYNRIIMTIEIRLGDVVRLRKPHPCGGYNWDVVRLGADIGLQCNTCGRRVLLTRSEFARRIKTFVRRGDPASGAAPQATAFVPPT